MPRASLHAFDPRRAIESFELHEVGPQSAAAHQNALILGLEHAATAVDHLPQLAIGELNELIRAPAIQFAGQTAGDGLSLARTSSDRQTKAVGTASSRRGRSWGGSRRRWRGHASSSWWRERVIAAQSLLGVGDLAACLQVCCGHGKRRNRQDEEHRAAAEYSHDK